MTQLSIKFHIRWENRHTTMVQTSYSTKNKAIKETSQLQQNKTLPIRATEPTHAEFGCAEVKEQKAIKRIKYYKIIKGYL